MGGDVGRDFAGSRPERKLQILEFGAAGLRRLHVLFSASGAENSVVKLLAGDAVTVTIKAIDIYADNTNWPLDILRTVSSTPSTINIARIRDAPGIIAVAP